MCPYKEAKGKICDECRMWASFFLILPFALLQVAVDFVLQWNSHGINISFLIICLLALAKQMCHMTGTKTNNNWPLNLLDEMALK